MLRLVAGELSFPTSLAFAEDGAPLVAESGLPFGGAPPGGRILKLRDGAWDVLGDGLGWPLNGLTAQSGAMFVSEGGPIGRISRILPGGEQNRVLDELPGPGDYHTNMTAIGPDSRLYFSQGALTNSAIVGLDAYEIGWLGRLPDGHDIPGSDIVLTGANASTANPLADDDATAVTGAFQPFGQPSSSGQRIPAALPCTAAVMSCELNGSDLRLVAWGLRNAFGLLFLPDGRLLATEQGCDERGSRPVADAPDVLYDVTPGAWYGWPDFIAGVPVTDPRFRPAGAEQPEFVLANHHELPPPATPLLCFPPHSAALKMDVLEHDHPVWPGQILVALFGDERPMTAPEGPPSGRSLARIDPSDWSLHTVAATPLRRPIDVRRSPADGRVYVLDFGDFEMRPKGRVRAASHSGALWRLDF